MLITLNLYKLSAKLRIALHRYSSDSKSPTELISELILGLELNFLDPFITAFYRVFYKLQAE